ncbi:DNA/RNA non-specific endonuclease [Acanthopleuribacter pedis]|uniref:DNA/RNA non-specific endonuclease n=1 Tax=Acanthopleuribacter pedis TaxID=442870 RepID=A0A8J7Q5U1_9BACT|nr:DNA/RNA non-specific endonuclease [Acanthopleuribacter pedis]MBO1318339.1 DNA/RNA non-specific endonuclease [Acanthopleuribacter pedis]
MKYFLHFFLFLVLNGASTEVFSQSSSSRHIYGGAPSDGPIIRRNAYVFEYDQDKKSPRWVAYRLIGEYRKTPEREGQWEKYRDDESMEHEPKRSDWQGAYDDSIRNYAKGHLAPFFISGGDRDGDGLLADGPDEDLDVDDPDDAKTVYEINYFSNLVPQAHDSFNGAGGIWNGVETRIRETLLPRHDELWVFAGPIFGPGVYDVIGEGVHVAPMFFQIVIWEEEGQPVFEAYLLPHHQKAHGEIEDYLVSIRHIEAMTGLNFFSDLSLGDKERISTLRSPE